MNKTKRFKFAVILVLLLVIYVIYYFERPAVIDKWVKFYPDGSIKRGTSIVENDGVMFTGEEDKNDGLVISKSRYACSMTYKFGTEELSIFSDFRSVESLQVEFSQPTLTDLLSFGKDKKLYWSHSKIYHDKNNEENNGTKVEQSYASFKATKTISVYRDDELISERESAAYPNSAQYFEPTADVVYYEKGRRQVEAWRTSLRKKLNLKHPELETCDYVEKLSFSERWDNPPR